MYNPPRFKSTDLGEAFELMDRYPFASLVSVTNGKPLISHLPLTPVQSGEGIELIGHLARANPHWKGWAQNKQVTAVFQGPHAPITPKWYAENDVPTWNYAAAHFCGPIELIEDYDGIIGCLKTLTSHIERRWPSGWEFYVPDDLTREILPKSIVGFKIRMGEIDFKKKLSQNRSAADLAGITQGLGTRADDQSRAVLAEMLKLR